jgi:simple sugar transport system ATP-binding protein
LFSILGSLSTSVLVVSDDIDELRTCDRVLVIYRGRIVREFRGGWDAAELIGAIEGKEEDELDS